MKEQSRAPTHQAITGSRNILTLTTSHTPLLPTLPLQPVFNFSSSFPFPLSFSVPLAYSVSFFSSPSLISTCYYFSVWPVFLCPLCLFLLPYILSTLLCQAITITMPSPPEEARPLSLNWRGVKKLICCLILKLPSPVSGPDPVRAVVNFNHR